MKRILIILGPTSTGKTDLAIFLAKKLNGEILACDSRQVYKGLDIGTGKLPGEEVEVKKGNGFWEMDGVKVWMYDLVDPEERFTVKDYTESALKVIKDLTERGRLPIVIGGTGLYLKALSEGLSNLETGFDQRLRTKLLKLAKVQLQNELQKLSIKKWKSLNNSDQENPRRLIRAIELLQSNNFNLQQTSSLKSLGYSLLQIGLFAKREVLNKRIDERVIKRIKAGLIDEAEQLFKKGLSLKRMKELGLEYGVLADLISKKINEKEFTNLLKIKIHQYAKRQMTWFKKMKNVDWFDITDKNYLEKVEKLTLDWYNSSVNG